MEEKKKKKFNIVTIIFIVTTIIATIVAVYFYLEKDKSTTTIGSSTNDKNANTIKEEEKEDTSTTNPTVSEKAIEFDASKCINKSGEKYTLAVYDNADGLSLKLAEDKKNVTLSINWRFFGSLTGTSTENTTVQGYPISGFQGNIEDVYIGGYGQTITGSTLLYLLSDGTVEYTPLLKANSSGNITTYGKLPGVEGVVKFLTADINGGVTTLAQKTDGTFYDLQPILVATGNYQ